ncbi:uncharacterized protein si:dkey-171c9.3 isoform X2 [Solea solea]|nr:uncharacterized protein si:dkey-171c9.3 isoform X2 [Solea solea]
MSARWRENEADLENLGGREAPDTEALEMFAQKRAEDIIQSFMEAVEPEMSGCNEEQEKFAEELVSAVMAVALREVCVDGFQCLRTAEEKLDEVQAEKLDGSGRGGGFVNMDMGTDTVLQTSSDLRLYRSGLPVMWSLDYPDAPPTTPLLPELQRSRRSFARQLKGGLAKVFLPSPPPTTPKEDKDVVVNPRLALMEHLIHSLSAGDLTRDCLDAGAKMEVFAEALSSDIIDWVSRGGEKIEDDHDLHLLAQRLAETIISSSIHEAEMIRI